VLVGLFLTGLTARAQPVVSGVTASLGAGTRSVAIAYTLSHPQSLPCTVTVQASRDNGATWETVAATTGDIGAGQTSTPGGVAKAITWSAGAEWPAQLFPQVKLLIKADDGSSVAPAGFVLIPAGTFTMGSVVTSNTADPSDGLTDAPPHEVTLGAFYLATTITTYAEWVAIRDWAVTHGYTDLAAIGTGKDYTHPVRIVSWYHVVKWCNAKSEKEGLTPVYYTDAAQTAVYRTSVYSLGEGQVKWAANGYRLPTEAEWEYAGRGGLAGKRFPWGDADTITHQRANYLSSASYSYDVSATRGYHPTYATGGFPFTAPVGSFAANGYGLFDMAGNAFQWCWDWYGGSGSGAVSNPHGVAFGSYRTIRGNSWDNEAKYARVGFRGYDSPTNPNSGVSFRAAATFIVTTGFAESPAFALDLLTGPSLTVQPASQAVAAGQTISFAVAASGTPAPAFQWQVSADSGATWSNLANDSTYGGVTTATVTLTQVTLGLNGYRYRAVATNSAGSTASSPALLTVNPASAGSTAYLANLSVRVAMAAGQTLIVGFVIDGGAKPILVRAAGPTLNHYGLAGVVDPSLTLYHGGTVVAANDNWDAALATTFATLGAFAFDPASKDAALLQTISGPHSAQATATGAGAILVEAYDAGANDGPKLVNLSTRFQVGTGDNILIAGFVLSGTGTKQLLIRAVGPTLASYGVTGTLADPQLALYHGSTVIANNDNWSSTLTPTFDALGAFHLLDGSKDAALVVTLLAGKGYTAQVSGVGGTTGEALIEVYAVP
jgi:formylglycine-generating enzyme required for sulfatase activity